MTSECTPLLRAQGVEAGYLSDVPVLDDVSIDVFDSEIVAIVGPNGAGKSTVLKSVMGLLPVRKGSITFAGNDITRRKVHEIVRQGISFVPQGEIVFPDMTVEENLEMAWFALGDGAVNRQKRRDLVYGMFPRLTERRRQRAGSMSGGERQMVALGRALMTDPRLILLDEPSLGLSPQFLGVVLDAIKQLRELGIGIAVVEQNAAMALEMADRGYVLDMGKVVFTGTGHELLDSEDVRRLYVGGSVARPDPETPSHP